MNKRRKISCSFAALAMLAVVCSLSTAQVSEAQVPQIPNGCGPDVPGWVDNGVDKIFLNACSRHDLCWGQCNGPNPPYLGLSHKVNCDLQFLAEMEAACLAWSAVLTYPVGEADDAGEFLEICTEVAATFYAIVATPLTNGFFWRSQCRNGCNRDACTLTGITFPSTCGDGPWGAITRCYVDPPPPPPPPTCECYWDSDCDYLPPPEWGTWECRFCNCLLMNSPLVLHLPDYFSSGGGNQSWWKKGFCTPEAPTVCLDWSGDGNVTCTGWTAPESEIAFVVALSDDDMLSLSNGLYVPAQPWRHFFGNVTMGPEGSFPFAHGFEALAAHCGLDPEGTSDIDLAECGSSLHVWGDGNGDGHIDPGELLEFQDLGVESLGDLRTTGKKDACGNTFPAESHATCADHPGKCGTWLDVFFEPR